MWQLFGEDMWAGLLVTTCPSFQQKARDNRAVLRISKAQKVGEVVPRRPAEWPETGMQITPDQHVKEGQRLREVEQEHDWRQRQVGDHSSERTPFSKLPLGAAFNS